MTVGTSRRWSVRALTIARTFLATTLLLSAFVGPPQLTFRDELAFLLELLLGTAIAAGWLMRYAGTLVLVGTIAERVQAPHSRLALLPANTGATAAVLIASGILVCFCQSTNKADAALIDENNKSSSERSYAILHEFWDEDVEVTIRLEHGHFRSLWKHRCIVTTHNRAGGVQSTGQEAWYARHDR